MRDYNKEDFIIRYPGIYDEKEQKALDKFWEEAEQINHRGPVNVKELIDESIDPNTPGLGPVLKVTEAMIQYNHAKYEQENPLFHDKDYAVKCGYKDIPAYFVFGAHDDTFTSPFPEEARDTLLVSQASHYVEHLADVYAGDTLYLTFDKRTMLDLTPEEGSVYRSVALYNAGTVYNQNGEVVNHVSFHYVESVKTYKSECRPADFGSKGFADIWEDPDWFSKEDHLYTDADYEYMKEIWKAEEIRGAKPRYWEDVQIGDEPLRTLEGPMIECALPAAPYGQGIGGTRTMKKEILDEAVFATMTQDAHGIYRLPNEADYTPQIPDGARPAFNIDDGREAELNSKLDASEETIDTADIHGTEGDERAAIINFCGRDLAIHHINNWMGDAGRIDAIWWSIMPAGTHADYGKPVPFSPLYRSWLNQAPKMKNEKITTHGLTRDIAEVCSQVSDKFIKNGKYMVKLIWWIKDINGSIWIEGSADIELPHR